MQLDSCGIAGAGFFAGLASRTATAPAERLKVLMASQRVARSGQMSASSLIIRLVHAEGIPALWRGNWANCLKVGPAKAVKFATYESGLKWFCKNPGRPTCFESCIVASVVALTTNVVVHPLDTVKTLLAGGATPIGTLPMCKHIWQNQGLHGFTAGIVPCLLSTVPFVGVSMGTFTVGKHRYSEVMDIDPSAKLPNSVLLALGTCSTICAEAVAYPFFCIKTNLQVGFDAGVVDCAKRLVFAGGPRALYRGVGIATAKSIPSASITFVVYENAKVIFQR